MPAPTPPTDPVISNLGPTSVTLSWTPSTEDNGSGTPIGYIINQYIGPDPPGGTFQKSIDIPTGNTANITSLKSGQIYTFYLWSYNNQLGLYSTQVGPIEVTTLAAAWIRHNGVWVSAVPYIRTSGVWKMANPYVRVAGVWQPML